MTLIAALTPIMLGRAMMLDVKEVHDVAGRIGAEVEGVGITQREDRLLVVMIRKELEFDAFYSELRDAVAGRFTLLAGRETEPQPMRFVAHVTVSNRTPVEVAKLVDVIRLHGWELTHNYYPVSGGEAMIIRRNLGPPSFNGRDVAEKAKAMNSELALLPPGVEVADYVVTYSVPKKENPKTLFTLELGR